MFRYTTLCFLILFCYCNDSRNPGSTTLTEEQKRKYFIDSFSLAYGFGYYDVDSARSFQTFFKKNYPDIKAINSHDAFPYALEEEYIDTTKIESGRRWFRVTVTKPFQRPYVIKTDSKYGKSHITAKITNGDGGYYTGTLAATLTSPVKDSLIAKLFQNLDALDFWNQPLFSGKNVYTHPEVWVIEVIDKGRYRYIVRRSEDLKKDDKQSLLYKQVMDLARLVNLSEVLIAMKPE